MAQDRLIDEGQRVATADDEVYLVSESVRVAMADEGAHMEAVYIVSTLADGSEVVRHGSLVDTDTSLYRNFIIADGTATFVGDWEPCQDDD